MRFFSLALVLLLAAGAQAGPEKILADTQFNLALNYFKSGKLEEAKAPLAKALATIPKHPQANLLSGIIACKQARFEDGVKYLKAAQESLPNNPDIYHNLGVAYSNLGKLAEAEEAFGEETKLRPGAKGLAVNMGVLALKQKKYKEAVTAFKRASKENPDDPKIWLYIADAHDASGDKAAGTEAKSKALELDPENQNLRVELGQRLYEAGALTNAATVLQAVEGKGDAGAEFLLGVLAYRDGRFDDSRARFEAALKARADYSEARYNLAITYYDQGKFEEALSQFEEVLRLHPNDEDAKKNLDLTRQAAVRAYLKAGSQDFLATDYLAALSNWRKAQALDKENKVVRDLVDTAQAQLKLQSEELNAKAKSAWDAGDKSTAIQSWAAALERDADNAEAQRGLEASKGEAEKLKAFFQKESEDALADGRIGKAREAAAKVASLDKEAAKALVAVIDEESTKLLKSLKTDAKSAREKGELGAEVDAWQRASNLDSGNAEVTLALNQAKVRMRLGLEQALTEAEKAEKAGKLEAALKDFHRALTIQPANGTARDALKRLSSKSKSKAVNPAELDDWYYQGVYAYAAGETQKAQVLWKKVLAEDAKHRLAKEALDRAIRRERALKKG